MSNEQDALEVGANKKELLKRLRWTVGVLNSRYSKFFRRVYQQFDFDQKRLYGFDGFYLQWRLRLNPDEPESYENQQTSIGVVTLEHERD